MKPHREVLAIFALAIGCGPAISPSAHELHIDESRAHAKDEKLPVQVRLSPKNVRVVLRCDQGPSLVHGSVSVTDPGLMPHVTSNAYGVAVAQDFMPEPFDTRETRGVWTLQLGAQPMVLHVHTQATEWQELDLGGCAIAQGDLINEGGHMVVDFGTPALQVADSITLWSVGYLELKNLGRARAKKVSITNAAGNVEVDVGVLLAPAMEMQLSMIAGRASVKVPAELPARAELAADTTATVEPTGGWRRDSSGALVNGQGNPRLIMKGKAVAGVVQLVTQ